MLEQLRQNSRSFIIWILFAMIIGAFVFTFGAQGQVDLTCRGSRPDTVMTIDGDEVSARAWQFYMGAAPESGARAQRVQRALDMVLRREILAMAAEDAGFRVNDDQLTRSLKDGYVYIGGERTEAFRPVFFNDGYFDYERLRRFVYNQWNMPTVDVFLAQQQREALAYAMATMIADSATASEEEAMARFRQESTLATIDAVRFRPFQYRRGLVLTDDQVQAYLDSHGDEVKKSYEDDKAARYTGVKPQLRVRQIKFDRPVQTAGADGTKPAGAGEAKPAAPDPGKLAADKALARLEAGANFAALAREVSQDQASKAKGGDLGWRRKEAAGLGATALTEALGKLEPGQHSGVIETPGGYYILKVEAAREGDLSYDDVKHEIAERLAIDYYAKEDARRDAEAALARAKAEGKPLDELFEHEAAPSTPQLTPEMLQQLQDLPPELRQQLLQQMLNQNPGSKGGSLTVESGDVPTAWTAEPGEGAAGKPATPAAAPTGAPAGGAASNNRPPAGGAASNNRPPAGGAASKGNAAAAAGEAAGAATAGGPEIPRPADVPAPKVRRFSNIQRDIKGFIPGLGESEELVAAVFDTLEPGGLAPQVYEVGDDFVIVGLISRSEPNLAEFEKDRDQRVRNLAHERGQRALDHWLKARCRSLAERGKISVNPALVGEKDEQGKPKPLGYSPCATL